MLASDPMSTLTQSSNQQDMRAPQDSQVSGISRRIHGWSWQAFPIVMGTSAVFMTLSDLKRHPAFVSRIEMVFFVFSISLFLVNMVMLFIQAISFPRHAWSRLQDPIHGISVPLMAVSFATIIVGTINYDVAYGHVSSNFIYALFWVYLAIAMATCFPMIKITFSQPRDLLDLAPSCAFPVFPLMLTGLVSANTLRVIDAPDAGALGVLLVGYVVHGLGLFMAFFFLSIYIIRLMINGFMQSSQSNLAFVACSPPGFSALTLMSLGDHARSILSAHGYITEVAGDVWYSASVMASLLLYGLALFFFVLGVITYRYPFKGRMHEILTCWAMTFPNVGWINATRLLGDIFAVQGFFMFHLVMTILMCITWLVLTIFTATAFFQGKILKSGEEDVNKDVHWTEDEVMENRPTSAPVISSVTHHLESSSRTLITV
ncbi:voltage-dependent anion channel-domain-containing protein [Armillaria novae-zelandiae]|uniref:Voltage-dependent anion channel-domain-containing protein n=1 Tax=Armillaria novae-zelandiae TaxID=153914 RepID=A0AA39NVA1_9AGAR|nr:voltage-dependent anion channel-domain-containing protein [Armillaria novae-zelandiae]